MENKLKIETENNNNYIEKVALRFQKHKDLVNSTTKNEPLLKKKLYNEYKETKDKINKKTSDYLESVALRYQKHKDLVYRTEKK